MESPFFLTYKNVSVFKKYFPFSGALTLEQKLPKTEKKLSPKLNIVFHIELEDMFKIPVLAFLSVSFWSKPWHITISVLLSISFIIQVFYLSWAVNFKLINCLHHSVLESKHSLSDLLLVMNFYSMLFSLLQSYCIAKIYRKVSFLSIHKYCSCNHTWLVSWVPTILCGNNCIMWEQLCD